MWFSSFTGYKCQIPTVVARDLIVLSDSITLLNCFAYEMENVLTNSTLRKIILSPKKNKIKVSSYEFKLSRRLAQRSVQNEDGSLNWLTLKDMVSCMKAYSL